MRFATKTIEDVRTYDQDYVIELKDYLDYGKGLVVEGNDESEAVSNFFRDMKYTSIKITKQNADKEEGIRTLEINMKMSIFEIPNYCRYKLEKIENRTEDNEMGMKQALKDIIALIDLYSSDFQIHLREIRDKRVKSYNGGKRVGYDMTVEEFIDLPVEER